jgi:hypothetical protein
MEGSSELGSSVDRVIWALRGWCSCSLVRLSDHQTSEFQVVGDGFQGAFGCSSVPCSSARSVGSTPGQRSSCWRQSVVTLALV